jgi:hypothetical protein
MNKLFGAAGALALAMVTAAPAQAQVRYYSAEVTLTWTDRTCVDVIEPNGYDRTQLTYNQACRPNGIASVRYAVSSGEYFGVDPIMGDNTYLHCSASLNGVQVYNSWGTAGDGTDINCIGIAP